jgi:hypothetical protein
MAVRMFGELDDVMGAYLAEIGALADVACGGEVGVEEFASEC